MTVDIQRLTSSVNSVASNVARSFHGYADADDIASEIWIWLLGNKETVRRYDEEAEGAKKLNFVMRQKANTYAGKQKAAKLGYSIEDVAEYSVKTLKELLTDVFDYENWESGSVDYGSTPKAKRIESTGERVTSLIDVKAKLEVLDERNYNIVIAKFKYHQSDQEIADMLEVSLSSVPTSVNRAVAALGKLLNSTKMEPKNSDDRRIVMSNAASRAALSHNYEG
jgi:DNA-directed RNA polymerase specialized sigma24 family protein